MRCRSEESPFSRDAENGSALFKWPLARIERLSGYFPCKSAPEKGSEPRRRYYCLEAFLRISTRHAQVFREKTDHKRWSYMFSHGLGFMQNIYENSSFL
jgi:hypothetical protein